MTTEEINAYGTVVTAATSAVLGLLTFALLLEARATRLAARVATVEAYARLWGEAGLVLALRLENHGPAAARTVELTYRLTKDGQVLGQRRHAQPMLAAQGYVTFLPDALLIRDGTGRNLSQLAEMDVQLEAEWTWEDARRRFWLWPSRHSGTLSAPASRLSEDFYGGWSLREPTLGEAASQLAEDLGEIRKDLHKIATITKKP